MSNQRIVTPADVEQTLKFEAVTLYEAGGIAIKAEESDALLHK
jgi:hypothetical protein